MYNYQPPSMFSGKRGAVFLLVIVLHILVGYAFYSGLARKIQQTIIPPVEIAQIDKPKENDKPPPPPPKLEEIKPYVPPPEFVDIQAPVVETTAITQVTQSNAPAPVAPPAPPPPQVKRTAPRPDPRHPTDVDDYYPDASKRANEEGKCIAAVKIGVDGKVSDPSIQTSTGFPRLDEACLKVARIYRFLPATADGKPVEVSTAMPIVFKIKNEH
jgi:protein TonB